MIARGQDGVMTGQWWVSFFPGLAILGSPAHSICSAMHWPISRTLAARR